MRVYIIRFKDATRMVNSSTPILQYLCIFHSEIINVCFTVSALQPSLCCVKSKILMKGQRVFLKFSVYKTKRQKIDRDYCDESSTRARICKRLKRPEIDSEDSIPPAYVAWRAGATNRVVVPARQAGNRFLVSLKGIHHKYGLSHNILRSTHIEDDIRRLHCC